MNQDMVKVPVAGLDHGGEADDFGPRPKDGDKLKFIHFGLNRTQMTRIVRICAGLFFII